MARAAARPCRSALTMPRPESGSYDEALSPTATQSVSKTFLRRPDGACTINASLILPPSSRLLVIGADRSSSGTDVFTSRQISGAVKNIAIPVPSGNKVLYHQPADVDS